MKLKIKALRVTVKVKNVWLSILENSKLCALTTVMLAFFIAISFIPNYFLGISVYQQAHIAVAVADLGAGVTR